MNRLDIWDAIGLFIGLFILLPLYLFSVGALLWCPLLYFTTDYRCF